ncbi:MAG: 50S ribosomal protein L9 [Acidimicrobiaceae bacterium]|nr:50S ribosomal protein L9 [Acidimicrobiaceae bacterium]
MKIVLRTDIAGIGKRGDLLSVADGYARNYLLPRGFAIPATPGIQAQADSMRRSRDVRDLKDRKSAEEIAQALVSKTLVIPAHAGKEGKLYGSVTSHDIADAVLAQTGIELDRRRISVDDPIRSVGMHEVPVKLHAEVEFRLNVEVVAG